MACVATESEGFMTLQHQHGLRCQHNLWAFAWPSVATGATDISIESGCCRALDLDTVLSNSPGLDSIMNLGGNKKATKSPLSDREIALCCLTSSQREVCPGTLLIYQVTLSWRNLMSLCHQVLNANSFLVRGEKFASDVSCLDFVWNESL